MAKFGPFFLTAYKLNGKPVEWHGLKILSFGAGMQSTALALMSCENAWAVNKGRPVQYPEVPIYDLVIFCDLGFEPPWVKKQADFVRDACETAGIWYKQLDTPLYQYLMRDIGKKRVVSIPWWTLGDDGHKSRMHKHGIWIFRESDAAKELDKALARKCPEDISSVRQNLEGILYRLKRMEEAGEKTDSGQEPE